MAMININLLPKRFTKRSAGISFGKNGIYTIMVAAGVLLMFGAVSGWQLYKTKELRGQMEIAKARTAQLEKDIQMVDALMDIKAKITDRLEAVERLDRHRSSFVKILEDISTDVPDFVWLSKFSEKIPLVSNAAAKSNDSTAVVNPVQPTVKPAEIEGFSFTLNALASFMIKLMRSSYFDEIDLVSTQETAIGKQKAYNFRLSCNVHYLSDEEIEKIFSQESPDSDENIN